MSQVGLLVGDVRVLISRSVQADVGVVPKPGENTSRVGGGLYVVKVGFSPK